MDNKPVVTFAGDSAVFKNLQSGLMSGLPTEAVEWKRSYGRTSRSVYVETNFVPFNAENLPSKTIIGQPVFHTYWTDCMDMDSYKATVRDDIQTWQNTLKRSGSVADWIVIVVETPDNRKGNKLLPRTTVLDKLKQDLGGKTPERCLALIDPHKSDSRAAESWQTLLHKFRQFFLQSYNKALNKFEESIRGQREKRTDSRWNFCNYFLLQEELGFVYEGMGLFDEALVQYDELDALFTQFVLNANVGESPAWLDAFTNELLDWTGLSLDRNINHRLRSKIESRDLSLLHMRNYLFSRQCSLLLLMNKPWEVARRSLSFLHNTVQELSILEVSATPGSVCIWILLSCLEVLVTCARYSDAGGQQVNQYCLYTAGLWAYARDKLLELGNLCGLMPKQTPTSEQIHMVVNLTGGLEEDSYKELPNGEKNPIERLKEALSSKDSFQKNYLEMSELAISTYKHIGRIRSARLIGKDMAAFYMDLGQVQKAAAFLADGLKTFQQEEWSTLTIKTLLDLAKCYRILDDKEKYVRTCAQISSSKVAKDKERSHFFDEMMNTLSELNSDKIILSSEDIIDFKSCQIVKQSVEQKIIPGTNLTFSLEIQNNLPKAICCQAIQVALEFSVPEPVLSPANATPKVDIGTKENADRRSNTSTFPRKPVVRSPSAASNSHSAISIPDPGDQEDEGEDTVSLEPNKLDIVEQLDYKQDKSLFCARLVCRNSNRVLKRKDSSGTILKDGQLKRGDYTFCLSTEDLVLEPGVHKYIIKAKAGEEGRYTMTQMSIQLKQLDFLHSITTAGQRFQVTSEPPVIVVNKGEGDLYAGVTNAMVLSVFCGSREIKEGTEVKLVGSRGLLLSDSVDNDDLKTEAVVKLPAGKPFESISKPILVRAVLLGQKDNTNIEHRVTVFDPWSEKEKDVLIHFIPSFYTTFQLQTAMSKKFLQVYVNPLSRRNLSLTNHKIDIIDSDKFPELSLTPINGVNDVLVVNDQFEGAYLWELNIKAEENEDHCDNKTVKINFSVDYLPEDLPGEVPSTYQTTFQFQDYKTLYTIQAKVDPAKGSEFCRAATMCNMTIQLQQINVSQHTSLFYEVIADQNVWAVCGRQGAVVNIEHSARQNIILEVMPLVGGYLSLPTVRLSKYIPAGQPGGQGGLGGARLEPFAAGQVYNMSRSQQLHVLPPVNQANHPEFVSLP